MTYSEFHEETLTKKRSQTRLSSKLEKNLWAYAAAASARRHLQGMLASPQTVEAKIVYTPVNASVNEGFTLDLNNDGIADFYQIAQAAGVHPSHVAREFHRVYGMTVGDIPGQAASSRHRRYSQTKTTRSEYYRRARLRFPLEQRSHLVRNFRFPAWKQGCWDGFFTQGAIRRKNGKDRGPTEAKAPRIATSASNSKLTVNFTMAGPGLAF